MCVRKLRNVVQNLKIHFKKHVIFNDFCFLFIERILEDSYHGLIKENETFVEITPVIKVDEEKVCRLDIVKSQKEIPFKVKGMVFASSEFIFFLSIGQT